MSERSVRGVLHRLVMSVERVLDRLRREVEEERTPEDLRIEAYLGHGGPNGVQIRGRVLDDPQPSRARAGEGTWAAVRRTAGSFASDELPGVPLSITLGGDRIEVETDEEGYFDVRATTHLDPRSGPWVEADVALRATYRGLAAGRAATARIRVPHPDVDVGIISDVDDTILQTGARRRLEMILTTVTGSAVTRLPFAGVAELYQALEAGTDDPPRPLFYVSSSPWNLHAFLTGFLDHRDIPLGPLLLRDLGVDERKLVTSGHEEHKRTRIDEIMDLHPDLRFVLVGDSGQHDPQIYEQVVRQRPGRVRAVWIREVRPAGADGRADGGVEARRGALEDAGVPLVVAEDSAALARHAQELGLIPHHAADRIADAVGTS